MRLKSTMALIVGCLFVRASGALAADGTGDKSELSANVTESYQIRNKKFGDLLRPKDANSAEGTRIVLYPAEPWKCMRWKLKPAGESTFQVRNHFTSKTFIVNSSHGETNVIQTTMGTGKDRPIEVDHVSKRLK